MLALCLITRLPSTYCQVVKSFLSRTGRRLSYTTVSQIWNLSPLISPRAHLTFLFITCSHVPGWMVSTASSFISLRPGPSFILAFYLLCLWSFVFAQFICVRWRITWLDEAVGCVNYCLPAAVSWLMIGGSNSR